MQLKEILTFGGLKEANVIAGSTGMDKAIDSISVLEVAESTISTWVVKNQLYITSFYAIKSDVKMQKIIIETLSRSGCCGLVICHLKLILGEIHPDIVEQCEALQFPLIVADTEVSYVQILNPIIAKLAGREENTAKKKAKTEFVDYLLEEKELPEILENISYNIRHEISFFDTQCSCLYSNKGDLEREAERKYLQEHITWENKTLNVLKCQAWEKEDGKHAVIYFIKSKKNFFGVIIINYSPPESEDEMLEIGSSLNTVCALLFSRKKRLYNIEYSYQQEYISDLLIWNFRSTEVAVNRGRELGILLEDKRYVLVVNINAIQKVKDEKQIEELNHYIRHWFMPNITKYAKDYDAESTVHYRSDVVLLFLPEEKEEQRLDKLARQLQQLFDNNASTTISIGISNKMIKPEDIPDAYDEAFESAVLGRRYYGENKVIFFKDVCFLYFLKQMRSQSKPLYLSKEILKPLKEYDEMKGTSLLHTLKVLMECRMEYGLAAKHLFIHRNTLLYRKKQIEEVLGYPAFEMPYIWNIVSAVIVSSE